MCFQMECWDAVVAYCGEMLHGGTYTIFEGNSGPWNLLQQAYRSIYAIITSSVAWLRSP